MEKPRLPGQLVILYYRRSIHTQYVVFHGFLTCPTLKFDGENRSFKIPKLSLVLLFSLKLYKKVADCIGTLIDVDKNSAKWLDTDVT